jgi:hypothetical protein
MARKLKLKEEVVMNFFYIVLRNMIYQIFCLNSKTIHHFLNGLLASPKIDCLSVKADTKKNIEPIEM